jgi:hypothetical protein
MDRARSNASTRSPEYAIERDETAIDHERHESEAFRWFATSTLCTYCGCRVSRSL